MKCRRRGWWNEALKVMAGTSGPGTTGLGTPTPALDRWCTSSLTWGKIMTRRRMVMVVAVVVLIMIMMMDMGRMVVGIIQNHWKTSGTKKTILCGPDEDSTRRKCIKSMSCPKSDRWMSNHFHIHRIIRQYSAFGTLNMETSIFVHICEKRWLNSSKDRWKEKGPLLFRYR